MLKLALLFALSVCLVPLGTSVAQGDLAEIAFDEGRFLEAASLAQAETADAKAFRAKALLSEAISGNNGLSDALLSQAVAAADSGIALEPDHAEARLQRSIAQSLKTRAMTMREAQSSGLGDEAKAAVEALIAEDDTNAYAHMFLSVWHLEVWKRGGRVGAMVMGASRKTAREHYQTASNLAGDDASVHWQYARALAALNARKYRDEIDVVLNKALSVEAETALEMTMQGRAQTLQDALEQQPRRAVEALATSMN